MTFSLKILDPDMIADPDEVRPENSDDRMDGDLEPSLGATHGPGL